MGLHASVIVGGADHGKLEVGHIRLLQQPRLAVFKTQMWR